VRSNIGSDLVTRADSYHLLYVNKKRKIQNRNS